MQLKGWKSGDVSDVVSISLKTIVLVNVIPLEMSMFKASLFLVFSFIFHIGWGFTNVTHTHLVGMDKVPLSIIYWSVPVSSDGSAKFTLAQEQQPVCAHPRYRPHCQHQPKQVLNLTPLLFPVLSHIIFSKQFPAGNWHCLPNTLQYLNMQLHWLLHWLLPTSKGLVNQQDCTTLPTKPFSYGLNTRWHCTPSN